MTATKLIQCLACGEASPELILDLGQQPLANNFLEHSTDPEEAYPLAVRHCQHCHHLQLTHAVDPAIIYRNYLYVSGTSQTYVDYMAWYANWALEQYKTNHVLNRPARRVLDIGCNDGSQLDAFKAANPDLTTYGVDPAENLHPLSVAKGHNVTLGFWDSNTSQRLVLDNNNGAFDIVTSQNAFSHIPDPLAYLQLVRQIMNDDALMFISTSQADMVPNGEFDTIYHEHISFYNAASMSALARRANLYLVDTIKTSIHGTSYIFVLSRMDRRPFNARNIISLEAAQGLQSDRTYRDWSAGVNLMLKEIPRHIELARSQGFSIVGYGAAAKGMTLLNATAIDMDAIIDDNPLKQGRFSPGRHIPVVGPEYIDTIPADQPVLFVPLAWNVFAEIKKRIQARRNSPLDQFMTYFPEVKIK